MKHTFTIVVLFLFMGVYGDVCAQHRSSQRHDDASRPERLEKYRTMRLVETLKLSEEDAVKFFAKQRVHEDKQHELMKSRNDLLDQLEGVVRENKGDVKDIPKLSSQVLDLDNKVFAERERYQEELRQFLTPEQFGMFLLFERNFGRQVRDALHEMRQERPERDE
jgi:hypothetical protein